MPALDLAVRERLRAGAGFALATINLDHLVKLRADARFAADYAAQDIVVADGRPIVALSRLARRPVSLMPGSDLVVPLCRIAAEEGVPLALVGSTDQALADAATYLTANVPGLKVVLCHAPSGRFDPDGPEADSIFEALEASGARMCFLAFGAPKQERLALRGRDAAPRIGFISVGAGLDFLGGHQRRAPVWVRAIAMEWLWRALTDPVRLVPRYLKCAMLLPGLLRDAWHLRKKV
ncbi:MAG: WecB/TagA/CpsF family glycosyltransferase [Rhodobacteraceae bacterium]|nr:WecB/TagA/CpsF family glycosyltransferase [Paracoccaceae bacterium]